MSRAENSILAVKPGHDGAVAFVEDGRLQFCFEAEKDNGRRYAEAGAETWLKCLAHLPRIPQILACSGWSVGSPEGAPVAGGYTGLDLPSAFGGLGTGTHPRYFTSSHERSHLLCAYAMSPFEQGQPCYALVWEGHIGSFYFIDRDIQIRKLAEILPFPGVRYAFLYGLADSKFSLPPGYIRLSDAGKLMALTGFADQPVDTDGEALISRLMEKSLTLADLDKGQFRGNPYFDIGVEHPRFASLARAFSDQLFGLFESCVKHEVREKLPLLLSGGCALNCDWNSKWKESGLFSDVFVPPCANDSGSAIGTAVDAQLHYTGNAKLSWSVYSGEYPNRDVNEVSGFIETAYDASRVARELSAGKVLGWVRGRYEIGPRALGARSMLACPRSPDMLRRLNQIKRREGFRPIAPICTRESARNYFYPADPSPFMLEFRTVISPDIPAVKHVDGSARPQTVSHEENPEMYELLGHFGALTGVSVLCNTSLNFNGRGFINKLSDMGRLALEQDLDGFVFNDRLFLKSSHQ